MPAIILLSLFIGLILGIAVIGPVLIAIIEKSGCVGFVLVVAILLVVLYVSILGLQGRIP